MSKLPISILVDNPLLKMKGKTVIEKMNSVQQIESSLENIIKFVEKSTLTTNRIDRNLGSYRYISKPSGPIPSKPPTKIRRMHGGFFEPLKLNKIY